MALKLYMTRTTVNILRATYPIPVGHTPDDPGMPPYILCSSSSLLSQGNQKPHADPRQRLRSHQGEALLSSFLIDATINVEVVRKASVFSKQKTRRPFYDPILTLNQPIPR